MLLDVVYHLKQENTIEKNLKCTHLAEVNLAFFSNVTKQSRHKVLPCF
jgi:hypothetical protein